MAFEELKRSRAWSGAKGLPEHHGDDHGHPRARDRAACSGTGDEMARPRLRDGAVAELAAEKGADVTGVDLAPALIETAKNAQENAGSTSTIASGTARTSSSTTARSTWCPRAAASCSRPTTRQLLASSPAS